VSYVFPHFLLGTTQKRWWRNTIRDWPRIEKNAYGKT